MSEMSSSATGRTFSSAVGHFQLTEVIGHGGQGTVFACKDASTRNNYAAKLIHVGDTDSCESELENLVREIDNMKELQHPKLVNLIDAIWDKGDCLIVMDLASGGDIHNKLEEEVAASKRPFKGLGGAELGSMHVSHQLLDGLGYMHSKHIVHRDLKLENVLIVHSRTPGNGYACTTTLPSELLDVKIADLGFSKKVSCQPSLSRCKTCIGSPDFVAPEVLIGDYDGRADLWSVGVMVYALLCGQWPFRINGDDDLHPRRHQRLVARIKSCSSWRRVSKDATSFVQGLLTVDPDNRLSIDDALAHHWFSLKTAETADVGVLPDLALACLPSVACVAGA